MNYRIVSPKSTKPLAVFPFISKIRISLRVVLRKHIYFERINPMLFAPKEKGQGLVEYAIILALIAIVVIAVMTTLGKKVNNTFNNIGASLTV